MGIRDNSGFKGQDKRFALSARGTINVEQHFLERVNGNFPPIAPTTVVYSNFITEGFENGSYYTDFAQTSGKYRWLIQNDAPNQWYVGSDQPYSGTSCSYISNDVGITNAYTDGGGSDSHMIMEFKVPADIYSSTSALTMDISFRWRCNGEAVGSTRYDYGYLRFTDTAAVTSGGTEYTTSRILGDTGDNNLFDLTYTATSYTTWAVETGQLDVSGKRNETLRLIWSWHDDAAGGTVGNPPFAIDNIIISYSALT